MANGYYQMARGWMYHPCFKGEKVFSHREAWIWMIEQATWSPEGRNVNILEKPHRLSRGQLSHSVRFMRDAWGWKKGAVETFLKKLKTWDMIRTDNRAGQLIITICNYDIYQAPTDSKPDSQSDKNPTGSGQTSDKKEEREERKERKESNNLLGNVSRPTKILKGMSFSNWIEFLKRTDPEIDPQACPDVLADEADKIGLGHIYSKEWPKFHDYWIAQSGQRAVKADWIATWRNWLRRSYG